MRFLLQAWLFLMLGGALAWLTRIDSGYALLSWGHWSLETSLVMLVVMMAAALGLLYYLFRFLLGLLRTPADIRKWRQMRQREDARQELIQGLLEIAEGHWQEAEALLTRNADASDTPLLNYLSAARAAQHQGADDRRDAYIRLAHEQMPTADVAVALTQAELQLAHDQFEQALATLKRLRHLAPGHGYVLQLLAQLYGKLGDWRQLQMLLPELKQAPNAVPNAIAELELKVYRGLLDAAAVHQNPEMLFHQWRQMPPDLCEVPDMRWHYASLLQQRGEYDKAATQVQTGLQQQWDERLVELFGQLPLADCVTQLEMAQGWQRVHPHSAKLLLTLGRLSLRCKQWEQARHYLQSAMQIEPSRDLSLELGRLLEKLDEPEAALNVYRAGLLRTAGEAPLASDNQ